MDKNEFPEYPEYQPEVVVVLTCTMERIPEKDVKVEDISESFEGHDVLTFTCPKCGQLHRSWRYG